MINKRYYSELITIPTFEERFEYLRLNEPVGYDKFSRERIIHDMFYKSDEWLSTRRDIIIRDNALDLACQTHDIGNGLIIFVHHINPITTEDILQRSRKLFDPENLITTIKNTHDGIHYGNLTTLQTVFAERRAGDTKLW